MAKRKSKQKSAYEVNRQRILSYVKRKEKKGIHVDISYIPTERELREQGIKGSELTKKTSELKKITPAQLKKLEQPLIQLGTDAEGQDVIIDVSTGEIKKRYEDISPTAYRDTYTGQIHTREPAMSDFEIETIIASFRSNFMIYNPRTRYIINSWLDNTIDKHGTKATAIMIKNGIENVQWDRQMAYDDELLGNYIHDMSQYLGLKQSEVDDLMESIMDDTDLTWGSSQ